MARLLDRNTGEPMKFPKLTQEILQNYTRADRENLVKTLKTAKTRLWDGKPFHLGENPRKFICHAIRQVDAVGHQEVTNFIRNLLEGADTLTQWRDLHTEPTKHTYCNIDAQKRRHEWLDYLIDTLEKSINPTGKPSRVEILTKVQRRNLAKVFKKAQTLLWDGVGTYRLDIHKDVCETLICQTEERKTILLAINLVIQRLGACDTVVEWLQSKGYVLDTTQEQQAYRLAWLKDLEKEFTDEPTIP